MNSVVKPESPSPVPQVPIPNNVETPPMETEEQKNSVADVPPVEEVSALPANSASAEPEDVEMQDVEDAVTSQAPVVNGVKTMESSTTSVVEDPSQSSHPPIQPPAPPWPVLEKSPEPSEKPVSLHVQLPPAPDFSSQSPVPPSVSDTPGSVTGPLTGPVTGSIIAQSPSAISDLPGLPLSVAEIIKPAPMRKKVSLSDYTSRKAKKVVEAQSVTPGSASSPTLTTTSAQAGASGRSETSPLPTPPPATAAETQTSPSVQGSLPLATVKEEVKPNPPPLFDAAS